ncbi:hypothetical protein [Actinosynnema sp. ALI-1.44]|uniref:hypothetical protein n=1 Tax=Actinosynnema sp. ALI-1.44 TaxID=1933779 RepID=UPI00192CFA10|nr:hypothetical protein [Actinosynnema sp. ALI-1.44]
MVRIDQREQSIRDHAGLGDLHRDRIEDVDDPLTGTPTQNDRGRERRHSVRCRLLWIILVDVGSVTVEGMHQSPHHTAHNVAVHNSDIQLTGLVPDQHDVLRIGHPTGVQHVQFDVQAARDLRLMESQLSGVIVEVDHGRHGNEMPPDDIVTGRRPGQTSGADDQLKFLSVSRRSDVGGEQVVVDSSNRSIRPFSLGPKRPPSHPLRVSITRLGYVVEHRALLAFTDRFPQARRGGRVVPFPIQPQPKLRVRLRWILEGHPFDSEQGAAGLWRVFVVRGSNGRVLRQLTKPQHRLVTVGRARRVGLELLTSREELEKPNRPINRIALRIRSSAVVRHSRPFLTTEPTKMLIAPNRQSDTADTTPL